MIIARVTLLLLSLHLSSPSFGKDDVPMALPKAKVVVEVDLVGKALSDFRSISEMSSHCEGFSALSEIAKDMADGIYQHLPKAQLSYYTELDLLAKSKSLREMLDPNWKSYACNTLKTSFEGIDLKDVKSHYDMNLKPLSVYGRFSDPLLKEVIALSASILLQ